MTTFRLDLAYDGTGFHGYARQPIVRTVQGELEAALARVIGPVETFVAGRTDKGVHASGQVASFSHEDDLDLVRVQRSVNRQLGPEISLLAIRPVADDFHARFSAIGRAYTYRVVDRPAPDPFLARTAWHFGSRLDVDRMTVAARHVVGEHDFASFCRKAGDRSTMREVRSAVWAREEHVLRFDVEASSFCHQMVRSLVALWVEIGRGKLDPEVVPDVLAARNRHAARGAAPPHGLTLVRVDYPNDG